MQTCVSPKIAVLPQQFARVVNLIVFLVQAVGFGAPDNLTVNHDLHLVVVGF